MKRCANWPITRVLNKEDIWLIERVQRAVASPGCEVGPTGRSEICLRSFARKGRARSRSAAAWGSGGGFEPMILPGADL